MKVSLSLWSLDMSALSHELRRFEPWVDSFHLDIMDGTLTDTTLFGLETLAIARQSTDRPIVVHLMSTDVSPWIERAADAGADAMIVHPQACRAVPSVLAEIRHRRMQAGLAIELGQQLCDVELGASIPDLLCVMGTEIGVKGRQLDSSALATVGAARAEGAAAQVVVDGGIREHSLEAIQDAGAHGVVAGSIVTQAPDPRAAIARIQSLGV